MLGNLIWALSRPPTTAQTELVETGEPEHIEDASLVDRIGKAYRAALPKHVDADSFWNELTLGIKREVHLGLLSQNSIQTAETLRRPGQNTHFWGFDAICKAPDGQVEPHELVFRNLNGEADWRTSYALWLHNALVSLAEAVGALRVMYPETVPGYHYAIHGEPLDLGGLLDQIERRIGLRFDFPNPYSGELGLGTRRGVAGFRALQAIYQAWKMTQILRDKPNARVLEIGAGLGRTAYYAHRFGLTDYTIIDIPMTGAAQGYFLGRVLGATEIALIGEKASSQQIKVLPPESLSDLKGRYDLVLNVDSFTEMSKPTIQEYWNFAKNYGDKILSINHEFNAHIFSEFYQMDSQVTVTRYPYWMRRGYVEELVTFR